MVVTALDHIYLAVSDFERSERFYDRVMGLLGFRKGDKPIAGEPHAHSFNPVLQLSLRPARGDSRHDPYAPGLHHVCLQLATPVDVDAAAAELRGAGVDASDPKLFPEYHGKAY
jgi:catechol 2,3-dioxygenase-like lactoylglutathione lyase family enzyme